MRGFAVLVPLLTTSQPSAPCVCTQAWSVGLATVLHHDTPSTLKGINLNYTKIDTTYTTSQCKNPCDWKGVPKVWTHGAALDLTSWTHPWDDPRT